MFSAVIFTPGRTGSHIIIENLSKKFCSSNLIHMHNPLHEPINNNFIGILSRRHNIFEALLSTAVASVTNEFKFYSNKKIDPFVFPINKFKNHYLFHKAFYELVNKSYFKETVDIYYEDMLTDPKYLFKLFGIDQSLLDTDLKKSPYNYYELILNVNELNDLYNELTQTGISDSEIEIVRSTVENDLKVINTVYNGNRQIIS